MRARGLEVPVGLEPIATPLGFAFPFPPVLPEAIRALGLFVLLATFLVTVVAYAKIFSKAGYSPWLCLLVLIPLVNWFVLLWFAFTEWPLERGGGRPPRGFPVAGSL